MKNYRKVLTAVLLAAAVLFTAHNVNAKEKTYKNGDRGQADGYSMTKGASPMAGSI
jgi:hypothetical protein